MASLTPPPPDLRLMMSEKKPLTPLWPRVFSASAVEFEEMGKLKKGGEGSEMEVRNEGESLVASMCLAWERGLYYNTMPSFQSFLAPNEQATQYCEETQQIAIF